MTADADKKALADLLFGQAIEWEIDAGRFLWLRAKSWPDTIYVRINSAYPDGAAYRLVMADGSEVEFDDFPAAWSRPRLKWPESAKR